MRCSLDAPTMFMATCRLAHAAVSEGSRSFAMSFRDPADGLRMKVEELERKVARHPPRVREYRPLRHFLLPFLVPASFAAATYTMTMTLSYSSAARIAVFTGIALTVISAVLAVILFLGMPTTRQPSKKRWEAMVQARVEVGVEDEVERLRQRAEQLEAYIDHERPRHMGSRAD